MNLNILHERLLSMGFKIKAAPDEATIYEDAEGTIVTVDEPEQEAIKKVVLESNIHPVTGDVTPEEASILLQEIIIARDTR